MITSVENRDKLSQPVLIRQEVIGQGSLSYEMYRTDILIEGNLVTMYGLGIRSSLFNSSDSCIIRDISCNYDKVSGLFDTIVANIVLPCTLKDIVVDFIS